MTIPPTSKKIETSELHFRMLADTIPQLVWVTQANGKIDYINQRWFDFTGQSVTDYSDETWTSVIHPEDLDRVVQTHQESIRNRTQMTLEYRIRRHDGVYRWHLARTVFMNDVAEGSFIRFGTATDIHDQKSVAAALHETQEELRKSHDQLDIILQGVGAGVIAYDRSGQKIFANETAAKMSGFNSVADFMNASFAQINENFEMFTEDGERIASEDKLPSHLAFQGVKDPPEIVIKYRSKGSSEPKWSVLRSKGIYDAQGAVRMVVTVFRDITDRKLVEQEREQYHQEALTERARLEGVLKQVESGVMIISASDKSILFMNDKVGEIWRKDAVQFDGSPMSGPTWPAYRSIHEGLHVQGEEIEIVRGDGTYGYVKVSSEPLRDNNDKVIAAVVTIQDISEIRKQEQAARFLDEANRILSSSLEYYETLRMIAKLAVPKLGDWCSISVVEQNGPIHLTVMHENPEMIKMADEFRRNYPTDWTSDEGAARVMKTGQPELYPVVTNEMLEPAARDARHLELMIALKIHSLMMVPLKSRGKVYGVLTLILSTEGKSYSENDFRTAQALGERAGQAIENANLYEQAQNAIRSRDSLISVSAHELLTPVSGSKLQMQLMRKRMAQGLEITPAMLTKMVDQTEHQLDRLSRLVNEMLDLSRINLGKLTIERTWVNFSTLVADIVDRMLGQLSAADCKVTTDIQDKIEGELDSYRFEQVLSNLLSNTARYARGKSVHISLRKIDEAYAELRVEDQGIGIRPEDQERIFQRFERAATIDEGSGLGLGLFVVKQIVEAHGGTVGLSSEFGKGSRFIVKLPLYQSGRK